MHPELRPQNNTRGGQRPNKGAKPTGMLAATMADESGFRAALARARANSTETDGSSTHVHLPHDRADSTQEHKTQGTKAERGQKEFKGETDWKDIRLSKQTYGISEAPNVFLKGLNTLVQSACSTHDDSINNSTTETTEHVANTILEKASLVYPHDGSKYCLATHGVTVDPDAWIIDSGANLYVCNDKAWFSELFTFQSEVNTAGEGSTMVIAGGGIVTLTLLDADGDPFRLQLNEVAYVPQSRCNLLSTSKLDAAGITGKVGKGNYALLSPEDFQIGTALLSGGLYHLQLLQRPITKSRFRNKFAGNVDFGDPVWAEHRRLGHLSLDRMIKLTEQSTGMQVTKEQIKAKVGEICPICATTKAVARIPRDPARRRFDRIGECLHIDNWGPYPILGWDDTRHMCFIVDDATRMTWSLRLKSKDEAPVLLRNLVREIERKHNTSVLRVRGDAEFNKGPWKTWCEKKGIQIEPTAPYIHNQVGVAERVNRTLREGTSAMIHENSMTGQLRRIITENGKELMRNTTIPEKYWPEAMQYAVWIKNRVPTSALRWKQTPYEMAEGFRPDLSRELTWGTRIYVTIPREKARDDRKLHDARGYVGYFMGCDNESTYRVLNPDKKTIERVVYTRVRDAEGLHDSHDEPRYKDRDRIVELSGDSDSEKPSSIQDDVEESDNEELRTSRHFQTALMARESTWESDSPRQLPMSVTVGRRGRVTRSMTQEAAGVMEDVDVPDDDYVPSMGNDISEHEIDRILTTQDASDHEDAEEEVSPKTRTSPFYEALDEEDENDTFPTEQVQNHEQTFIGDESDDRELQIGQTVRFEYRPSQILDEEHDVGDNELPFSEAFEDEDDESVPELTANIDQTRTLDQTPDFPLPTRDAKRKRPAEIDVHDSDDSSGGEKESKPCRGCYIGYRNCIFDEGSDRCRRCISKKRNCLSGLRNTKRWKKEHNHESESPTTEENEEPCRRCYTAGKKCSWEQGATKCKTCTRDGRRCNPDLTGANSGHKNTESWKKMLKDEHGITVEDEEESDRSLDERTGHKKKQRDKEKHQIRETNRQPDKDKCHDCFHRNDRCHKYPGVPKCKGCYIRQIRCKPIIMNEDGTFPKKLYSNQPNDDERGGPYLSREECCRWCKHTGRKCDAEAPIHPRNPCTACTTDNKLCISQTTWQDMKDTTIRSCNQCRRTKRTCDKKWPCWSCEVKRKKLCSYTNGAIKVSKVPPGQEDLYDEIDQRCQYCKNYNSRNCDSTETTPCTKCVDKNLVCRRWLAPRTKWTIDSSRFKRNEEGDWEFDPDLVPREPRNVRYTRERRARAKANLEDTSDSETPNDEDESSVEHDDEHVERALTLGRLETRQRLANVQLPENFLVYGSMPIIPISLLAIEPRIATALLPDPQSYTEAMKAPDAEKWRQAIQQEYDSLIENQTWTVVDLPQGRKALTAKWVLKKKIGPAGEVLKYKARLVARGFQQVEGYDYTETYSGVVKAAAYRLLFALLALHGWTCEQMDVVTAFLNGDIYEEIYMHPPQGYQHKGKVLRLLKALYGLKQSPRLWYRKLRQWLVENGWVISKYDECVFYHPQQVLIITVYVDDINIFGPTKEHIQPFKEQIAKAFKMTDAGRAAWYLGMQLDWHDKGVHIHQHGYAQQILGKFGLIGTKAASVPLDASRKLAKEVSTTADPKFKTKYMSMTGSLNYLQTKTMWQIAYPLSLISRYMSNPNQEHMDALTQEYRYVAGHSKSGLFYHMDGNNDIQGFVDSDWGGDKDTGKSTTGWVFTLAGSPISWASQRQKTVAGSSTEAEYVAANEACKEAIWLRGFHNEIAHIMRRKAQTTIQLAIDNSSAIKLTKNPEFHGRTKHIPIRHHMIREWVEQGEISPVWISGKDNPADLFTKALPRTTFEKMVDILGGGLPSSTTAVVTRNDSAQGGVDSA